MRGDVYVLEVLNKCEALKKAQLWPAPPCIRPDAWLGNFDDADRPLAALLLDNFTYYSDELTNRLLLCSYNSLGDGSPKGPAAPDKATLLEALSSAVFTRVEGEQPSPTDSGNLFCRRARQVLGVDDGRFAEPAVALDEVIRKTRPVVFLDDFVGSGDQFIKTWRRKYNETAIRSFAAAHQHRPFTAIYVTLVATTYGLNEIRKVAPQVAITLSHALDEVSTVRGITQHPSFMNEDLLVLIPDLINRYATRLSPPPTISQSPSWVRNGYKDRGLLFAFEHSVPDATLPIFWAPGDRDWNRLVERR